MGEPQRTPRRGSSALVAGVTLQHKNCGPGGSGRKYVYQTIIGTAQRKGKRKRITRKVDVHGLRKALREVCQWRFENARPPNYESPEALYEDALSALP